MILGPAEAVVSVQVKGVPAGVGKGCSVAESEEGGLGAEQESPGNSPVRSPNSGVIVPLAPIHPDLSQ